MLLRAAGIVPVGELVVPDLNAPVHFAVTRPARRPICKAFDFAVTERRPRPAPLRRVTPRRPVRPSHFQTVR